MRTFDINYESIGEFSESDDEVYALLTDAEFSKYIETGKLPEDLEDRKFW